ncbi:MAG: thiamine phosphate synthase, partial [Terracidiphilus sp.]
EAVVAAGEHSSKRSTPARVMINDRLDVALAAGASGVHLGHESIPTADVVRWCRSGNAPEDFLIGVSCHGMEDVHRAEAAGANYVVFGPVFDTPSKRTFGPPQGIAKLEEACRSARIPVVAIGGVDAANAAECLSAGAAGIAAIRMFQSEQSQKTLAEHISKLHLLSVGARR